MVAIHRTLILVVLVASLSLLAACGSSSSSPAKTVQNVSLSLTPATPGTVPVGSTTGIEFTPTLTDPTNSGITWALTCPASNVAASCGALQPICPGGPGSTGCVLHSDPATTPKVTYIPPAVPYDSNGQIAGSMAVQLTAFATADQTKNQTVTVTVGSYADVLNGSYVFQAQGTDSSGLPYQMAGVLTFDGNLGDASFGLVTGGEETLNTAAPFFPPSPSQLYTLQQGSGSLPSNYFVGPDGRGAITLNLQQVGNSANVLTQTLSLVVVSSSKALIVEIGSADAFGGTSHGTLELQDPAAVSAVPSGSFAFVTSGTDSGGNDVDNALFGGPVATAIGGILNIDSPGTISGSGSLVDQDYINSKGGHLLQSCVPPAGVTGTVSPPDTFGAVTIILNGSTSTCLGIFQKGTSQPTAVQFTGYIVDASHIRLIESDDTTMDPTSGFGTGGFLTSGIAIAQGSAAGTYTDASLSGPYVFDALGIDFTGNSSAAASFTSATVANFDGSGTFSSTNPGIADSYFQSAGLGASGGLVDAKSSSYAMDTYAANSLGLGRANLTLNLLAGGAKPHPQILFYLNSDGTPLVLYAGGENSNLRGIGAGIAYPQAAGALSLGNPGIYGVTFSLQNGSENDGSGQMTTTVSGINGTITGAIDYLGNDIFEAVSGLPAISLGDTFTCLSESNCSDVYGRIATNSTFLNGNLGGTVTYYLIDNDHGFLVENDLTNSGQVGLGYFAATCDVTGVDTTRPCSATARSSRKHASNRASKKRISQNLNKH